MSAPHILWMASVGLATGAVALLTGLVALRLRARMHSRRRWLAGAQRRRIVAQVMRGEAPARALRHRISPSRAFEAALAENPDDVTGRANVAAAFQAHDIWRDLTRRRARRRLRMIHLFCAFPTPSVRAALRRAMVRDRDPRIRLAAAKALGGMNALPGLHRTIRALDLDGDQLFRVLRSVLRRLPPHHFPEVIRTLDESESAYVRLLCVEVLRQWDDRGVLPALVRATSDTDLEVRAAALRVIGRLGGLGAAPSVLRALSDPAWEVRCQACYCTGRIRIIRAIPALELLLSDPHWWVRFRAAEALYQLGGEARNHLRQMAAAPDSAGRVAQAVLLEREAA